MSRRQALAVAAVAAALAFGIPAAASAQDWRDGGVQFTIGSGGGYYDAPRWGGYDRDGGYDRRAAWYAHQRWEHEARERDEWRHRYWEHRRHDGDGYGRDWRERY